MKFIIVVFASVLCGFSVSAEEVFEVDGYKYLFSAPFKSSWFGANQYCRYRGMFLIDVPTNHEQHRLVRLIADLDPPYNQTFYWTSGTDIDKEGEFFWMSSGHPFVYTNWNAASNPSNNFHEAFNETENCVELRYDTNYDWNDHACHHKNYFICRNETISPSLVTHKPC